jgi:hypothetical protein
LPWYRTTLAPLGIRSSSGRDSWTVSAERGRLLFGHPGYDGVVSVAHVMPELNVGDPPASRMLAHPTDRDAQQLGDISGGEETLTHKLSKHRIISAYIDVSKSQLLSLLS